MKKCRGLRTRIIVVDGGEDHGPHHVHQCISCGMLEPEQMPALLFHPYHARKPVKCPHGNQCGDARQCADADICQTDMQLRTGLIIREMTKELERVNNMELADQWLKATHPAVWHQMRQHFPDPNQL